VALPMGIVMVNPLAALVAGSTESAVAPRMASVASPMGFGGAKIGEKHQSPR
jgi:hypothetical protein